MGGNTICVGCPQSASRPRASYRRRAPARKRRSTLRRRAPLRRRRMAMGGVAPARTLSKFLLGQIDPFNSNVKGAKVPDSNTYPSCAVTIEDETTLTTDATYKLAVTAFTPYLPYASIAATAATASTWTWTAAYGGATASSRQASVTSNYTLIRPVAHGVKIYAPTAPTTTTGFCHIAIVAASDQLKTTWNFPTTISQLNNCMWYRRVPLALLTQKSVTVTNKFLDMTATRYFDPSSGIIAQGADNTFQAPGWATIIVAVESSTASTNAVVVEQIEHIEALPLASGVNDSSPAAPYNVQDMENVSTLSGHVDATTIEGEEGVRQNEVLQALSEGVKNYSADVWNSWGRGAVRTAAQRATGTVLRYAYHQFSRGRFPGRGSMGISGVNTPRLGSSFHGNNR